MSFPSKEITMGKFLVGAKSHVSKIKHYYKHAGTAGYSQAEYHWIELTGLVRRASRSKNDKSDVPDIQELVRSVEPMMDEMKKRGKPQPPE
jgi:hypothetical protein